MNENKSSTIILKKRLLLKQGHVNKAMKWRYFVLYSNKTMSYYLNEKKYIYGEKEINSVDVSMLVH